jgi:hypothetical protein
LFAIILCNWKNILNTIYYTNCTYHWTFIFITLNIHIELNFFATLQWVCWLLRINFLWSKQLGLFRIPQRNIHRFIRQKLYVFYYLINSVNISKVEHSSIFPCDNKIFLSWNYLLVTEMSDLFSICIHRVI